MAGDARPSFDHQDIFQGNEQLFLTVLLFDLECNSRTYEPRCFESLLGLVRFLGVRITLSSAGYDIRKFP